MKSLCNVLHLLMLNGMCGGIGLFVFFVGKTRTNQTIKKKKTCVLSLFHAIIIVVRVAGRRSKINIKNVLFVPTKKNNTIQIPKLE